MGGFSNVTGDQYGTVMNSDNCSFDGTARGGVMTTNGQLWIGSTAAPHVRLGTLVGGSGITITPGSGTITIAATATGLTTTNHAVQVGNTTNTVNSIALGLTGQALQGVTGADPAFTNLHIFNNTDQSAASANIVSGTTYIIDNAATVTLTLPASPAQGDRFQVIGLNVGLLKIAQNANQAIIMNQQKTTVGTTGSVYTLTQYAAFECGCITAGGSAVWVIYNASGMLAFY